MIRNFKGITHKIDVLKRYYGIDLDRIRSIYQRKGHEFANINPLEPVSKKNDILIDNLESIKSPVTIGYKQITNTSDLKQAFDEIYCSSVGFEISHLSDSEISWFTEKLESLMTMKLSIDARKQIAKLLLETEMFDLFMQKRFSQVKRYGLEGCESAAVAFDFILKTASDIDHVMVTMPHRGRLNLMTVLMNCPPEAIFHKLAGNSELPEGVDGSADVLSHLSLQKRVNIADNENGLVTLLPNPSHLEAGNSVGLGAAYAYQKYENQKCLSVQFHGDAAFTGQGVVSECLQLSQLPNFSVNGTIHIICNNQLGFTTQPEYGRSSKYASDPAKAIDSPILHVNADSPEDVARATCLAVEYQRKFNKDIVIDLIGWRKMGHNELDEPSFTQPGMYEKIRSRPSTAQSYAKTVLDSQEIELIEKESNEKLETAASKAKEYKPERIGIQKNWSLKDLSLSKDSLISSAIQSVKFPEGFNIHPRLQKYHVEHRLNLIKEGKVDWATAEAMAFGSLTTEGVKIRLSGQDVARGTFSQRHLRFCDQETGEKFEPFENKVELAMSNLSEFGVLGFEYGLSIISGDKILPIWEAQFGDFFNGAQIVFDTFLSSGEAKWRIKSNLTILLPHGFDGAGPEHSSCRMERFLQSCDEKGNWIVAYPTTPANYLHLLRRQMESMKPLIIVGPKTLFKSPHAVSPIEDLMTEFKPIIKTTFGSGKRLIFMTGKFYYEIAKELKNVTIVRIEQLNTFPFKEIIESVNPKDYDEIIWCQEEPKNMGAYDFVRPKLENLMKKPVRFVGREAAAAPATGISKVHKQEIVNIMKELAVQ